MRQVRGTATYRERLALPPEAVFEATLEDVSKADAPAEVLGRVRLEQPGNPPSRFEITYDPARIIASHRYVVRARILVGDKLFFITDRSEPVLTEGQGNEVALLLRRAGSSGSGGGAAEGRESVSSLSSELSRTQDRPPLEPRLLMRGMYTYVADAGRGHPRQPGRSCGDAAQDGRRRAANHAGR